MLFIVSHTPLVRSEFPRASAFIVCTADVLIDLKKKWPACFWINSHVSRLTLKLWSLFTIFEVTCVCGSSSSGLCRLKADSTLLWLTIATLCTEVALHIYMGFTSYLIGSNTQMNWRLWISYVSWLTPIKKNSDFVDCYFCSWPVTVDEWGLGLNVSRWPSVIIKPSD